GKLLFRRELDSRRFPTQPKGSSDQLLLLEAEPGKVPVVHRLDALTGMPVAAVALQELEKLSVRPEALGSSRNWMQLAAADAERLYLPVDGPQTNGAPCIGAFDDAGKLVWNWTGSRGRRFVMAGLRGERLCVVESGARGSDKAGGKIAVLRASDGAVLRELDLGDQVQLPLNWHRSWLPEPAPPLLLLTDRTADRAQTRRLIAMALDDELPSFQQALAPEDGEGINTPVLGPGFLAFAVKPAQGRGPVRLYAVQLADRRGAFADGRKQQVLPCSPPYEMTAAGPYTVISAADGLILLGQPRKPR
ncbi:MAG TPA: hypothetical protein VFG37_03355, partial [Planctomycetota bacterium]|nr:hypothetical protein [Planctomycetota bacterium]